FATPAARFENQDAVRALIAEALAGRPTAWWLPKMQAIDLICQEVLRYDDYRRDPQVAAHRIFQEVDLGEVGRLPSVRMPGLRAEEAASSPPPAVGEHADDVLRDFGFDGDEVARLRAAGVVV